MPDAGEQLTAFSPRTEGANNVTATPMARIAALTALVCLGGATAAGFGEQTTCYVNPDQQPIEFECPGQEPYDREGRGAYE